MAFKKHKKSILIVATLSIFMSSLGISNANSTNKNNERPNVIFLIGDGMSVGATTFARWYKDAQDGIYGNDKLNMDDYMTGYVKTSWANGPITDSAPGGTAFATGQKTNDKHVGVDVNGNPLATLLEAAELSGMLTGLVGTSEITHATLADFSAHSTNRNDYKTIIKHQINSGVDVVLGGGIGKVSKYFDTENDKDSNEKYENYLKNIKNELKQKGYDVVTTKTELENSESEKVWGMFSEADLAYDFDRDVNEAYKEQPSISQMTKEAIEILDKKEESFFLMVEGSKIDWAAHANDPIGMASEIIAYDEAVKEAIEFAKKDKNTIVISTSDHGNSGIIYGNEETSSNYDSLTFEETIGVSAKGKISLEQLNNMIKGKTNEEIKSIASKYYGLSNLSNEEFELVKSGKANEVLSKRAKIGFTTTGHTGGDVGLYVYAPSNITELSGIVDNTEVCKYLASNMSVDLNKTQNQIFKNIKQELENLGAKVNVKESEATFQKDGHTMKVKANENTVIIDDKEYNVKTTTVFNKNNIFGNEEIINKFLEVLNQENTNNHWAKDILNEFVNKGYIKGYSNDNFMLDKEITRAEFITIVNRAFGFNESSNINFNDVDKNSWYYEEVSKAVSAGYINGYENNNFMPNKSITREEASKIIATILNVKSNGDLEFVDSNEVSSWAYEYVKALSDLKILSGYNDKTIKPNKNITRAESISIISNAINKKTL